MRLRIALSLDSMCMRTVAMTRRLADPSTLPEYSLSTACAICRPCDCFVYYLWLGPELLRGQGSRPGRQDDTAPEDQELRPRDLSGARQSVADACLRARGDCPAHAPWSLRGARTGVQAYRSVQSSSGQPSSPAARSSSACSRSSLANAANWPPRSEGSSEVAVPARVRSNF